jgi:hypothetical protein
MGEESEYGVLIMEKFKTGSVRDTRAGKGRYDLIPPEAIHELALHFEEGALKYGDRNWELGQPISRIMDSALRHAFSYMAKKDDENHLSAACWNLIAAMTIRARVNKGELPKELDDL